MGSIRRTRFPQQGDKTWIRVQRSLIAPVTDTSGVLTLNTQSITLGTAATAGAVSLTVTALTYPVYKDNFILFTDEYDLEYLVELTDDADAGATALDIAPLAQGIPAASVADWPPEFLDRTDSTWDSSASTDDFTTYNTGGYQMSMVTTIAETWTLPGYHTEKNAGLKTIDKAYRDKAEFWLIFQYPPFPTYAEGEVRVGRAVCTSASTAAPADGRIDAERSGNFNAAPYLIPSVPA